MSPESLILVSQSISTVRTQNAALLMFKTAPESVTRLAIMASMASTTSNHTVKPLAALIAVLRNKVKLPVLPVPSDTVQEEFDNI